MVLCIIMSMTAALEHTQDLVAENAELRKLLAQALDKVTLLEEKIDWFNRQIFGRRSERKVTPEDQPYLPGLAPSDNPAGDAPAEASKPNQPKKPRKNRKATGADAIQWPENAPVERVYLDIEEEKICPITNKPLIKIGEELTSKLAYRSGSFYIKQFIRFKYAYPKEADQGILTPELPDALLPKSPVDESFLAELCVRKYSDHLPCYRLSEIYSRDGLKISRQQISKWIMKAGQAMKPLYDLMYKKSKEGDIGHIDESPVALLGKKKGKSHQAYMWLWRGGPDLASPYSIYHFRTSRAHFHANELLKGYSGFVHSDKYEAYENLAKKGLFKWCPCWSHIRRYFFEAETAKELQDWFLRKIRYLFMLERVAWARSPEERLRIRLEKEIPIIDEMLKAAQTRIESGKDLPKSKMRKALGYFIGLKPYLKNYTKHAFARLDNNPVERQARPLAIGRKNWMFLGSEAGGQASAILFSLIQTCRSMQINPREYLEDVMRRINSHPFNRLSELLPDQWKKSV